MSVYLYDEALVKSIRKVTGDERIHVVPPENAISFLATISKDKVVYPAIVISRSSVSLNDTKNQYAYLKGETVRIEEDNTAVKIKLIPMTIEWSINVFAVSRFDCDEIIRELIFYLISHPRQVVKVPYNNDVFQNFDLILNDEIVDNSDLINSVNIGEYFRETISVYTENAHMFSSGKIYLSKVDPDVISDDKHWHNKIH